MKKSILMILLAALLLCGCGSPAGKEKPAQGSGPAPEAAGAETAEPTPSPTPTPAPTPAPTPVPELSFPDGSAHKIDETELDLKKLSHKDVAKTAELLRQMPDLQTIDLGTDGAWN